MKLISLPPLEEEPKDEKTSEFQAALRNARLTNVEYIYELEHIDQESETSADQLVIAERKLKDKIRANLGLHARQSKSRVNLIHHAKNNHIRPEYELPLPEEVHPDGRHRDDLIQTLLLPDLFEKRLNSIISKDKKAQDETGLKVLKAAYGFLEWKDNLTSKSSLAPLILLHVEIKKEKTKEGYKYSVCGEDEKPEPNTCLIEKMSREFGLEFPCFDFEKMKVEDYFNEIQDIKYRNKKLIVRRQVAIGVFPSERMAMYHDLDTSKAGFESHKVLKELFEGSKETTTTIFAEDYEVDSPEIEMKVNNLVMDTDSSQFSTIVDVMNGKNIAVEGPPGTGKSQTIVNTIATALSNGLKVLFVAEKMAALDVVRDRLNACDLGEFLLTLQPKWVSKANIIESIRERMKLDTKSVPKGLDEMIERFKQTRSEINKYINIISSVFFETKFTVHDIIGMGIRAQEKLSKYTQNFYNCNIFGIRYMTKEKLNEIADLCNQLESVLVKNDSIEKHWSFIKRANIDPYSAEGILKQAQETSNSYSELDIFRAKLTNMELSPETSSCDLEKLKDNLCEFEKHIEKIDIELVKRITNSDAINKIHIFFENKDNVSVLLERLKSVYSNPLDICLPEKLNRFAGIVNEMNLPDININTVCGINEKIYNKYLLIKNELDIINEAGRVKSFFLNKSIKTVIASCRIGTNSTRSILSLRKQTFEQPFMKLLIKKSEESCNELKQVKEKLQLDFHLESLNKDEINDNCQVFTKAGFFAVFSSKYRIAKRTYISMTKDKKFKKDNAIVKSKMITQWIDEVKTFIDSGDLLEHHFNGLSTDYQSLNKLMNYYNQIDTELAGIDNKEVRDFLKRGDVDEILSLPKIDTDYIIKSNDCSESKELSEKFDKAKTDNERFEDYKSYIEKVRPLFVDYKSIDVKLLSKEESEIKELHEKLNSINNNNEMKNLLGCYFKGTETKKEAIQISIDTVSILSELSNKLKETIILVFQNGNIHEVITDLQAIIDADKTATQQISKLAQLVRCNVDDIILSRSRHELSFFLNEASRNKQGLLNYSIICGILKEFYSKELDSIIDKLIPSKEKFVGLSEIVLAVIGQLLVREVYMEYGTALAGYDGSKLNHLRKSFASLDREIIKLSKAKIKSMLKKNCVAPNGNGYGNRSEWTDMALLRNEMAKTKRHIPVRDLTNRASSALLELKPCWMVSPLAVAQYINKNDIEFDLVIIDEASQMTPEDAIGALARGKQAMIVGDTNQLPPSNFMKKIYDDIDDDNIEIVTEESILEMANAVFRPARRLRWHYRSRHPSLIACSNKYLYNNELIVFCPPTFNNEKQGVFYRKINGFYKGSTNPIESTEITKAVIEFMLVNKDMSLGVVLMNGPQRDLVNEEIEFAIHNNSMAAAYIDYWKEHKDGLESFFVKNLENVQGDERDVIFIGTVYGPEREGAPVHQRFAPINGITGQRRLNVLFTRAKQMIITFSSMTSNDLRVKEGSSGGVELLKNWLEFSATGQLLEHESTDRKPDNEFEMHVIDQLKLIGCETVPQVGVTGYFIDIGIKHPAWPHGFIMGIECDGATYHSSKSARERDRLRQEVLEGLGWYFYRVWSTDWFSDPLAETEKLREVIKYRLTELNNSQKQRIIN